MSKPNPGDLYLGKGRYASPFEYVHFNEDQYNEIFARRSVKAPGGQIQVVNTRSEERRHNTGPSTLSVVNCTRECGCGLDPNGEIRTRADYAGQIGAANVAPLPLPTMFSANQSGPTDDGVGLPLPTPSAPKLSRNERSEVNDDGVRPLPLPSMLN